MKRKPQRDAARKLSFQSLQQRELMAGDVSVSVTGGDLVINGDNQANDIRVYQKHVGSSTWYVDGDYKGGRDTTVNGRTGPQVFRGVVDDVRIYSNGGSDWLNLKNGRVRDELYIRTGSGNDGIYMTDISTGRDVNINLGSGSSNTLQDYVFMQGVNAGDDILIDGSRGRDNVIIDHTVANDLIRVRTGAGNDNVRVSRSKADRYYAYLGSGNDTSKLEKDEFQRTHVSGGYGSDSLTLKNRGGSLGYFTRSSIATWYL